ncbi:MAG: general secretion pathway protein GspB [Burkholderiales bacterium]|nr:general secretion pathway protein GspB [Burkholderiales bacterium]
MSYILDALRRADSERERGAVPGLRAQPVPPSAAPDAARAHGRWWRGLAGVLVAVLGVVAVSGAVWWARSDRSSSAAKAPDYSAPAVTGTLQGPKPPPHEPAPDSAPLPPATPTEAAAPVIVLALPNAAVAPVAPVPAVPAVAAVPESRPVSGAAQRNATGERSAAAPDRSPAGRTAPDAATRAPTVAPGTAGDRILSLAELPDDVRRTLPTLAVSGATYSETPAHRMVIINGQVVREGEEPAPGVVLERIQLKSAILRYRGLRYSVPY